MKVIRLIRKTTLAIIVVIFGVLVALTIVQVFMRYVMNNALMWGDEFMRFLMIWGINLSGGIGFYYQSHMAVDNILVKMPPMVQKIMRTIICALIVALACFYVWQGSILVEQNIVQIMPSLHISRAYLSVSLPISAVLWIIFSLTDLYYVWTGKEREPLIKSGQDLDRGE